MGTKLQFAINPLSAPPSSSRNSFLVNQISGFCGFTRKIGSSKQQQSEEYLFLSYFKLSVNEMFDLQNIESIKNTMIMQDDIFKLQVRELHQLYERQMKLMYELKNKCITNMTKQGKNSEFSATMLNQNVQNPKIKAVKSNREDPVLELSASCCSIESPRIRKQFNLKQQQQPCPSSSENEQKKCISISRLSRTEENDDENNVNYDDGDQEIDVELTLSIGCSRNKNNNSSQQVNPYYCKREVLDSSNCRKNHDRDDHLSTEIIKRDKILQEHEISGNGMTMSRSSGDKLNRDISTATTTTAAVPSNWFLQDLNFNRNLT